LKGDDQLNNSYTNSYPRLKEPFLYFAKEVFEMQETNFYEEHPEKEGWWLNELIQKIIIMNYLINKKTPI
jgi:hypothetical protein